MQTMSLRVTENDLVRYLYNELTKEEKTAVEQVLACDTSLRSQLKEMSQGKKLLNRIKVKPSARTIDNILAYSKSYKKRER